MLWIVPVWFWNWYAMDNTGMLWAVPVLSRTYRYCPDYTDTVQSIPVLPRAYQFQKQKVLPRTYRYCPEHTGTAQVFHLPGCSSSSIWSCLPLENRVFVVNAYKSKLINLSCFKLRQVNSNQSNVIQWRQIILESRLIDSSPKIVIQIWTIDHSCGWSNTKGQYRCLGVNVQYQRNVSSGT